jgi:ethanolamine kinase
MEHKENGNPLEPPYHDMEIEVGLPMEKIEVEALRLLRVLRPGWTEERIRFKAYTNGITNKIFRASHQNADGGEKERLLFRIYGHGTEKFIDRRQELETFVGLSRLGLAAPVYARFRNGLVCGFLDGKCVDVDEVREKDVVE